MRNRLVNFRILDVFHPDPNQLLRQLHGDDLLQGVVVEVSHGAPPGETYLVVQVEGVASPVIVPQNHVREAL